MRGGSGCTRLTYLTLCSLSYSFATLLTGCSTAAPPPPSFVSVGGPLPASWPSPGPAVPGSPPKPLAMHFSTLSVPLGGEWSGELVTTSDAAGVELMTNLFSLRPVAVAPGRFRFRYRMLDLPPFLVRGYKLRVFVRNAAGQASETDIPFRLSGRPPGATPEPARDDD